MNQFCRNTNRDMKKLYVTNASYEKEIKEFS